MLKLKNSTDNKKVLFFSKKFLSFSKSQKVADDFLSNAIRNKYKGVYVRIIVDEVNNNNNYSTNIDINKMNLSEFNDEEEVLFLPLSTFEVIEITEDEFCKEKIKIIKLKYLNEYENEMNRELKYLLSGNEESKKKMDDFIKNGLNSKFSEEISKCLDIKINNNLQLDYLKKKKISQNFFNKIINSAIKAKDDLKESIELLNGILAYEEDIKSFLIYIGAALTFFGVYVGVETAKQINEEKEETKYLKNIMFYNDKEFYCDSLYYGYLPEKYRKKYIPSLK